MRHQPELQALAPWVAAFGITPDKRISTPLGDRPAHDLVIGDLVNKRDDGPQKISNIREAFAAPSERSHYPRSHCPRGVGVWIAARRFECWAATSRVVRTCPRAVDVWDGYGVGSGEISGRQP